MPFALMRRSQACTNDADCLTLLGMHNHEQTLGCIRLLDVAFLLLSRSRHRFAHMGPKKIRRVGSCIKYTSNRAPNDGDGSPAELRDDRSVRHQTIQDD